MFYVQYFYLWVGLGLHDRRPNINKIALDNWIWEIRHCFLCEFGYSKQTFDFNLETYLSIQSFIFVTCTLKFKSKSSSTMHNHIIITLCSLYIIFLVYLKLLTINEVNVFCSSSRWWIQLKSENIYEISHYLKL